MTEPVAGPWQPQVPSGRYSPQSSHVSIRHTAQKSRSDRDWPSEGHGYRRPAGPRGRRRTWIGSFRFS